MQARLSGFATIGFIWLQVYNDLKVQNGKTPGFHKDNQKLNKTDIL
ncbi:hypothetical protein [Mucilaginibacter dorajii]|nr:hypothetical protein [Mucilaginibacter dorajii]MCS3735688.1 hypothetical protein [Mucilaginibacter dorajii]